MSAVESAQRMVVVGVDRSDGARAALRFALDEAKLRRATLRAVHAWQFGYIDAPGLEGYSPVLGADLSDLHSAAGAALEAILREAIPDPGGVEIECRVVEGAPGAVLVAESRDADLLVVGSRGHGGFAGLLLGSVSQQCAHHAACPVVIVPHTRAA
jgi:nucleotide-binding universal stress UspA family protein